MTDATRENLETTLKAKLGQEIHVSDWWEVGQSQIDAFASATGDRQWIHTDVERAARESPWRTTVAHGYLTLSLYPMLRGLSRDGRDLFPGVRTVVNYGLNRLRFVSVVRAGAFLRARVRLTAVDPCAGGLQICEEVTMEIRGARQPAAVAEILTRLYF
jgi:acyl dehydratase